MEMANIVRCRMPAQFGRAIIASGTTAPETRATAVVATFRANRSYHDQQHGESQSVCDPAALAATE